jgi:hypothetical protein
VIVADERSQVLVEAADGEQRWYRRGEAFGDLLIESIDNDGIVVENDTGRFRLELRGDSTLAPLAAQAEPPPVPRDQLRNVDFRNLTSRIAAVAPVRGESQEHAIARNLNDVLGLADRARITSVDRVRVSTAAEARNQLLNRLSANEAIRISIEDDALRTLYIAPE